jgi:CRP/FNR family transcriptional regulator, transcriptional activator FtrB
MLRETELGELSALHIFAGCRPDTVADLLKGAFYQKFPAGVELARTGESADFLHVVVSGRVELFASYLDRESTIDIAGSLHTFIVAAVVTDRPYLNSARVLEPSKILMLPASAVRGAMIEDAAFASQMAIELATAYRNVIRDLKNQKLRSSLERLANWLVLRDAETGSGHRFTIPFDKKVLASRLGMAPEVLSRAFGTLARYDVIIKGADVVIRDPDSLVRLAKPHPLMDDPQG